MLFSLRQRRGPSAEVRLETGPIADQFRHAIDPGCELVRDESRAFRVTGEAKARLVHDALPDILGLRRLSDASRLQPR